MKTTWIALALVGVTFLLPLAERTNAQCTCNQIIKRHQSNCCGTGNLYYYTCELNNGSKCDPTKKLVSCDNGCFTTYNAATCSLCTALETADSSQWKTTPTARVDLLPAKGKLEAGGLVDAGCSASNGNRDLVGASDQLARLKEWLRSHGSKKNARSIEVGL